VLFSSLCTSIVLTIILVVYIHYATKAWYGEFVGLTIFGESEMSVNVDLNDEPRTMVCRFVLQTSATSITNEVTSNLQIWFDVMTEGIVLEVSKQEVQVCAFILSSPLQEFVKGI
jgi:hypothetical protein